MKKRGLFIVLIIISFVSIKITAQIAGSNDVTFNTIDSGNGIGDAANNEVNAIAIQSDGKIIIGGSFTTYNGVSKNRILRLNAEGTIDNTFNIGIGANAIIRAIVIQTNGKILIGGDFTNYSGVNKSRIMRLNSNGTIDATFTTGTGVNNSVNSILIQPNGKIILGGNFTTYNGTSKNRLVRLDTNGVIDGAFTVGSGVSGVVNSIAIQQDSKVLIGGSFSSYNGLAVNNFARIDTNGVLDGMFATSGGAGSAVNTIAIQSDKKIVLGGSFTTYAGVFANKIVRVDSNGVKDGTFVAGANNTVNSIVIQSDGKILMGGSFFNYNGQPAKYFIRLKTNGSIDSTFAFGSSFGANAYQNVTVIQPNGKILIGGFFTKYNGIFKNYFTRLETNGTIDQTFNMGTGADEHVITTAIQNDGKILIGGAFTSYNGNVGNGIARLNSDGTFDTTFIVGTGIYGGAVQSIAIQSDGKILIAGNFMLYNNNVTNFIARLNQNGSLDTTFSVGVGPNANIYCLAIQPDGKILAGGDFYYYNGISKNLLVRLNPDGSLDPTLDIGPLFNNTNIQTISIQPDGKILIGGTFFGFNSTFSKGIARLDINGNVDTTFHVGTGFSGSVYSISLQNNGKIIVGGTFNYYDNVLSSRICRLNANGTLDITFNTGSGTDSNVLTTVIQPDGKILAAGPFTTYKGNVTNGMMRLNINGALDASFSCGLGAGPIGYTSVRKIELQSDGKILIGGSFTNFNSVGRNRISRLENSLTTNVFSNDMLVDINIIYPNPTAGVFTIDIKATAEISITNVLGEIIFSEKLISGKHSLNIQNQAAGIYFVKVVSKNEEQTIKIIKQ